MNDLNVYRFTEVFGLAVVVLLLIKFPFRVVFGVTPPLADARYADDVIRTNDLILTIILIVMFIMACILVFLAGFRYLIQQAREDDDPAVLKEEERYGHITRKKITGRD